MARTIPHPWHGIPARGDGWVHAFVECAANDPLKIELDNESGVLFLDRSQATSAMPPCAYGFVPRTLCGDRVAKFSSAEGGDGDPLDIFVISEHPIRHIGIFAKVRVLGAIPMVDQGDADDKLVAVLANDPAFDSSNSVLDLPRGVMDRLQHFLENYKPDHYVYVGEPVSELLANQIIDAAMEDYDTSFDAGNG